MLAELPRQRHVFPLPQLYPIPKGRRINAVGDRADPPGLSASHLVICARLQQGHHAASRRPCGAAQRPEHACRGNEHGARAASDGRT